MKKFLVAALFFTLIIAAITVPDKQQYVEWLKEKIKQESGSQLINLGVDLLGSPLIEYSTSCKNYVILSICNSNFSDSEQISAIGVFNNFFDLQSTPHS